MRKGPKCKGPLGKPYGRGYYGHRTFGLTAAGTNTMRHSNLSVCYYPIHMTYNQLFYELIQLYLTSHCSYRAARCNPNA